MTEEELIEIVDDLKGCLDLLEQAGDAFRSGNEQEMMMSLGAMAPRLERATHTLDHFLKKRREGEALFTSDMDQDLSSFDMEWGYNRTEKKSRFVADGISIALREKCDEEFLLQIDQAPRQIDSTESGLEKIWDKMIQEPRFVLEWGGVDEERAYFRDGGGNVVEVDASHLATIRALTLFERAELSTTHPESIVLCRQEGTPVAALLTEEE